MLYKWSRIATFAILGFSCCVHFSCASHTREEYDFESGLPPSWLTGDVVPGNLFGGSGSVLVPSFGDAATLAIMDANAQDIFLSIDLLSPNPVFDPFVVTVNGETLIEDPLFTLLPHVEVDFSLSDFATDLFISFYGANGDFALDNVLLDWGGPVRSWINTAGGSWNHNGNWDLDRVPNGNTFTAALGNVITTPITVSVDNDVVVKRLEIDSIQPYTLGGPATLSFGADSGSANIVSLAGDHVIETTLSFNTDTNISQSGGTLSIQGDLAINNGAVINSDVHVVIGPFQSMAGNGVFDGGLTAVGGSTIRALGGDLAVGDSSVRNGFYSNGTIYANGNIVSLHDSNDAVLDSGAFVDLGENGELDAINGLTLDFGGNIVGRGTLNSPNEAARPLVNNGNISGNSLADPITLTGYVKGVGTCDNCNITGTDAPGFSTATVNRGSVSYNGTLEIEIGGTTPGSGYDQLNHILGAGVADLGGTLDVQLTNGFTPSYGDTYQIIAAKDARNRFETVLLPTLSDNLQWTIDYQTSGVSLLVSLTGDFDVDGDVDGNDFLLWQRGDSPNPLNPTDLIDWKSNFGIVVPLVATWAAVPEPSTCITLIIGMMNMLVRGRRISWSGCLDSRVDRLVGEELHVPIWRVLSGLKNCNHELH